MAWVARMLAGPMLWGALFNAAFAAITARSTSSAFAMRISRVTWPVAG